MAYKCPVPTYAEIFPCLRLEVPWTTDEELGLFIAKKKLQKPFTTCLQIHLQEVPIDSPCEPAKPWKKNSVFYSSLLKTLRKRTLPSVWSNNIFNKVYVVFSVALWCRCIRSIKWLHSNIRGSWGSFTVRLFAQTLMFKSESMVAFVAAKGEFFIKV